MNGDPLASAEGVGALLIDKGWSLATAESVTGGAVAAALAGVDGSGRWLLGGVMAYATSVKRELLGVPRGPVVTGPAAICMAEGAGRLLGAHVGVATTGCAGPARMEGQAVGTVWVAVVTPKVRHDRLFRLEGTPEQIRGDAAVAAIETLHSCLLGSHAGLPSPP